jgi:hypothetical protein
VAYDRASARLLEQHTFAADSDAAFAKRLELEVSFRGSGDVEVVLLSAQNMDDLKISHARYFDPGSISADRLKTISDEFIDRLAS